MNRWRFAQYCAITLVYGCALVFGLLYWLNPARLDHQVPIPVAIALYGVLTFITFHRPLTELYGWVVLRKVRPYKPMVVTAPPRPEDKIPAVMAYTTAEIRQFVTANLIDPETAKEMIDGPADETNNDHLVGATVALITYYVPGSETLAMVTQTLMDMVAADYPHDTWVLDEGNDEELKEVCRRLGVMHFSRLGNPEYNTDGGKYAERTKGGNLNSWYDKHGRHYTFVAQFDTDFRVTPDVLTGTLGHFRDPRVAYVGTPQVYGNEENLIARGAAQQTYGFYGFIMRGLGDREQGLLIGANHIMRVSAIEEIGFYYAHLVEDLATGMTFAAHGWKGLYVPQVFAVGEGPAKWSVYFSQQYRWAFGGLDLLRNDFSRLARKMPRRQALRYLWMLTFYLNGLAMGLGVMLLSLYYLTGVTAGNLPLEGLVEHLAPLFIWRQVMTFWAQQFNVRPEKERGMLWASRLVSLAVLPVYLMALIGVIRGKRHTYQVTQKGDEWQLKGAKPEGLQVFKPHLVIALIMLGGMGVAGQLHHTNLVYFGWGVLTAATMIGFSLIPTWVYYVRWAGRVAIWRMTSLVRRLLKLPVEADELILADELIEK